jgi:2-amino-4-hydroxy-6-hydroxymethyldihydropteridine diphosphokinase
LKSEPEKVYLSLGSNIEPRLQHLTTCQERLEATPGIDFAAASGVYETEAEQMSPGTAAFLNQVICVEMKLTPIELLEKTEGLERDLGRISKSANNSRTIDIDILLFGQQIIYTDSLIIPHPRLHLRAFALIPLLELDNRLKNPNTGQLYRELVSPDFLSKVSRIDECDTKNKIEHTMRLEA